MMIKDLHCKVTITIVFNNLLHKTLELYFRNQHYGHYRFKGKQSPLLMFPYLYCWLILMIDNHSRYNISFEFKRLVQISITYYNFDFLLVRFLHLSCDIGYSITFKVINFELGTVK